MVEHTHKAVGVIGEPLSLRVEVEWEWSSEKVRMALYDSDTGSQELIFSGPLRGTEWYPSPSDEQLNESVHRVLHPFSIDGEGWTTDSVSTAAHYSLEWGWKWMTEKFARGAL
ncbi:hypothetical protein [Streptomyces sp. NPDC051561]|uniref:hypothetical protein n=1 Tax=Streptomyces sp. NPDC051561 TaxID=3365658 RepID=UPI003794DFAA